MRPVYLFWSEDVNKEEISLVHTVLGSASQLLGIPDFTLKVLGNWHGSEYGYGSFDWYMKRARVPELGKLDGGKILKDFTLEPWQRIEYHLDFAIVGRNLTVKDNNDSYLEFVFGVSDVNSVISSYQFNQTIMDRKLRLLCLQRTVIHQLCHALGIFPVSQVTNRNHHFDPHCTNLCVMRQGISVQDWARYAEEEYRQNIVLCPECQYDIRQLHPQVRVLSGR